MKIIFLIIDLPKILVTEKVFFKFCLRTVLLNNHFAYFFNYYNYRFSIIELVLQMK